MEVHSPNVVLSSSRIIYLSRVVKLDGSKEGCLTPGVEYVGRKTGF